MFEYTLITQGSHDKPDRFLVHSISRAWSKHSRARQVRFFFVSVSPILTHTFASCKAIKV